MHWAIIQSNDYYMYIQVCQHSTGLNELFLTVGYRNSCSLLTLNSNPGDIIDNTYTAFSWTKNILHFTEFHWNSIPWFAEDFRLIIIATIGRLKSFTTNDPTGHVILVAITGTAILVPYLWVQPLQLIWRSGTRRCHLRVPDLQISCWLDYTMTG